MRDLVTGVGSRVRRHELLGGRAAALLPRLRLAAPEQVGTAGTWAAALLLALVTWRVWPVPGVHPTAGLDSSWRIALHLAATHRLHFGHDVVFTYGPLGFLVEPLTVEATTGALSIAFSLALWLALTAAVLSAARRAFATPVALAVAYLALCLPVQVGDILVVLAFFITVRTLEREQVPRSPLLVVGGGVYAGLAALVKLNNGVVVLVLLALAAWRLRPGRLASEALLLGSFGASAVAFWLFTGNPLGGLPGWVEATAHVFGGYTQTMATDNHARLAQAVWAACLLLVAIALLALHLRRSRPALWLAAVVYTAAFLKEGFVRHDGHDLTFFGAFGVGLVAIAWEDRRARRLALATLLATICAVLATPDVHLRDLFRPVASASQALDDARLVAVPSRLDGAIASSRAAVRKEYALDPRILASLRGRTVDVVPLETAAVWAYGLRWRPEPVLQDYAAYDGYLDRANAGAILRRGADRILLQLLWPVTDGTHPLLEAPATVLARVCHYRMLQAVGTWAVLARGPNRCGIPERLGSATARAGHAVSVPAPPRSDELVYARIRLRHPFVDRVAALLFKPFQLPDIVLGSVRYRFVAASAANPLVLRLPAAHDLPEAYKRSVDYRHFTLLDVPSPFEVEFFAVRLERRAPR